MKKYIFIIATVLLLLGAACTKQAASSQSTLTAENAFVDFGVVPMYEGNVTTTYTIKNTGDEPVVVQSLYTSCMCTKARLTTKEDVSPYIGMKGHGIIPPVNLAIAPGETVTVDVAFDPAAHGPQGVGLVRRAVYLETNSTATPSLEVGFQADVVLEKEKPLFEFSEIEYDFGVIKQSAGMVTHDFTFTYNGEEPTTITGVPTSCSCTTAKANKTELKKGDTGIISVAFDPNLHEEPEEKFFKTITINTEPPISPQPEITIWVDIDLDLGPDAYTLKNHTDDQQNN